MIFGRATPSEKKHLKLDLNSDISINLIDSIHVNLHPCFKRPESLFFIKAIGEIENNEGNRDIFNIYAENNNQHYLITLETTENKIECASLYQNTLTITPQENEWSGLIQSISAMEIELDGIQYQRVWGGNVDHAELCNLNENVKTLDGNFECENQLMLYERKINPGDFVEQLRIVVEFIESRHQADVSFYVGFDIHPSTIRILGN